MARNKNTFVAGGLEVASHGPHKPLTLTIDGKKTSVEYKELWGIVYLLGNQKHKADMIPVQKKEMMQFVRKYRIKAKHDLKAGEEMVFWAEINIPQTVVESIAEEHGAKVVRPGTIPETP